MGAIRQYTRSVKISTGVEARYSKTRNSLRVIFWYKGKECRETLQIEPSPGNIKYVTRLRGEILNAISRNTFSYADYFPSSKKAALFGHVASNMTVGELLIQYLDQIQRTQQHSTYDAYCQVCHTHLIPLFGQTPVTELTPMAIRRWISQLSLTAKTVNNILIPLRAVCDEAVNDDIIERNPLDRVVLSKLLNKNTIHSDYMPEPFNKAEINSILAHAVGQGRNLFQFAFFTGLRVSELIALRWEDIDWVQGLVCVRRAVVQKKEKCTKTKAGMRDVVLFPPALQALQAQKEYTFLANKRVFHNPQTGEPWETHNQIRKSCWQPILKKAGVRYRNPYQARHTYASMLLSRGENMLWVAKQMGHRDTEMVMRTYGKWIPDAKSTVGYQPVNNLGDVLATS